LTNGKLKEINKSGQTRKGGISYGLRKEKLWYNEKDNEEACTKEEVA